VRTEFAVFSGIYIGLGFLMFLLLRGMGERRQKKLYSIECWSMLRVREKGLSGVELVELHGSHPHSLGM
jgi:hypothetical protein